MKNQKHVAGVYVAAIYWQVFNWAGRNAQSLENLKSHSTQFAMCLHQKCRQVKQQLYTLYGKSVLFLVATFYTHTLNI